MRFQWLSILITCLVALTGCQRNQTDYDDYLTRLEKTLELKRSAPKLSPPSKPQRHLLQPPSKNRYGLFDTYSLKPCGVLNLVADHNNQLGRVATPSQQLIYHYRMTHLLSSCDTSNLSDKGKQLHAKVLNEKQIRLPSYGARLILLSDAIWNNIDASESEGVLGNSEIEQALIGLAKLRRDLVDPSKQINDPSNQLESLLKVLYQQRQPRQLNRAMLNAINGLSQATTLLQQATQVQCESTQFEILFNILHQIYAKRIQPQLVKIQRDVQAITPALQQLLSPWPDTNYFRFFLSSERDSLRAEYEQAIELHSKAWQQLFERCDAEVSGKNFART